MPDGARAVFDLCRIVLSPHTRKFRTKISDEIFLPKRFFRILGEKFFPILGKKRRKSRKIWARSGAIPCQILPGSTFAAQIFRKRFSLAGKIPPSENFCGSLLFWKSASVETFYLRRNFPAAASFSEEKPGKSAKTVGKTAIGPARIDLCRADFPKTKPRMAYDRKIRIIRSESNDPMIGIKRSNDQNQKIKKERIGVIPESQA